ncbi:hypothetical protein [Variovorax sp. MHTC-1]|uniref:hypothetical protein n=1 Tax=Variovorax sp. MHTC-1 TaxID=2495593 RepID=UPI000F88A127|nr:hypothetical protein [Variovorax sp. MHTC-1]RST53262.1 hypothetical protein EJI01_14910 [Variovorax sp. MHTC-1]
MDQFGHRSKEILSEEIMNEDGEVKRFVYADWEIRVCLSALGADGQTAGHADLWREGAHLCRVALSGRFADEAQACDALERKARDWVDDWSSRDHTGNTGFVSL